MPRPRRVPTPAPRDADFREALRVWARIGLLSLRRARRADRAHAPHAGRRAQVDRRAAVSSTRSTSACCCRGPRPCSSPPTSAGGCTALKGGLAAGLLFVLPGALVVLTLSMLYAAFGKLPLVGGAVRRRQGGGAGHRGRGAAAHRQARAQGQRRLADRGRGLRRHLLPDGAVPADRARGGPGRLLARPAAPATPSAGAAAVAASTVADAAHGTAPGSPSGSLPLLAVAAAVRARPRADADRLVLLQARGGDVRRRLRGARLHGPGRGRALRLAQAPARCSTASASPRRRRGR